MSQKQAIRAHLDMGLRITGKKAFTQFGVMHLPRRILDLIEGGYPIAKQTITVEKADGSTARVTEYRKA